MNDRFDLKTSMVLVMLVLGFVGFSSISLANPNDLDQSPSLTNSILTAAVR